MIDSPQRVKQGPLAKGGNCYKDSNLAEPYTSGYDCSGAAWGKSSTHTTYSCYKSKGYVSMTFGGIPFSNLCDIGHCDYMSGSCYTSNNIYIEWKPNTAALNSCFQMFV